MIIRSSVIVVETECTEMEVQFEESKGGAVAETKSEFRKTQLRVAFWSKTFFHCLSNTAHGSTPFLPRTTPEHPFFWGFYHAKVPWFGVHPMVSLLGDERVICLRLLRQAPPVSSLFRPLSLRVIWFAGDSNQWSSGLES
jgi:hypothetical protein